MRYTTTKKYEITPRDMEFMRDVRRYKTAQINTLIIRVGVPVRMVIQFDKSIEYTPKSEQLSEVENKFLELYKDLLFGEIHNIIIENGQIVEWEGAVKSISYGKRRPENSDSYSVSDRVFD